MGYRAAAPLIYERTTMNSDNPQQTYFLALEKVPTPVWHWLGIGSIAASLILKLRGRGQDALFVGQWSPTFFILALLLKQTPPSQES